MTHSILRNRLARPSDAAAVARMMLSENACLSSLELELTPLLERLLATERIKGMIIESLAVGAAAWTLDGLGLSVFPAKALVDEQMRAPQAMFLFRLLERAVNDAAATLLGVDDIARANARGGLDLMAFYMQTSWDFASPHWRAVGVMAHEGYVRHHRGYRIHRALHEGWDMPTDIYLASGFRRVASFDVLDGGAFRRRHFYCADQADLAQQAPGSTVSFVLDYVPPQCAFSRSEQRLLAHAIEGHTDGELAAMLGLSPNTLKQAWRSVYSRIERQRPQVFAADDADDGSAGRGPEKRRRALAFIKDNLQELRPHPMAG